MISQKDTSEALMAAYDDYREKDEFAIDNNNVEFSKAVLGSK